jgi:TPP-dependent pyruvate/acetoin dehydrogenase alpha subunit
MHLMDASHGVIAMSAVVSTTIPTAVGYAYAVKCQHRDVVVASFFGDGATEEGVFYESLNFAALKSLPVIFICENNGYAIHTRQSHRQATTRICDRVRGFGVSAETIEENDVMAIRDRVNAAVSAIRNGHGGPFFFECMTYRWKEHVGPGEDYHLGYRTREEAAPWIRSDALLRIADILPVAERECLQKEIDEEIRIAFEFAERSPFPGKEELLRDVYGE